MEQKCSNKKPEECISIKGCKIILRYSEAPTERVMDHMGKILCGQKYAPEICKKVEIWYNIGAKCTLKIK